MRKKVGIIKRNIAIFLIIAMSINSFGAIVSDNDGSAFITKAEFDALKSSFQAQIDTYNQSIDSKIDGAIASYINGLKINTTLNLPSFYESYRIIGYGQDFPLTWSSRTTRATTAPYNNRLGYTQKFNVPIHFASWSGLAFSYDSAEKKGLIVTNMYDGIINFSNGLQDQIDTYVMEKDKVTQVCDLIGSIEMIYSKVGGNVFKTSTESEANWVHPEPSKYSFYNESYLNEGSLWAGQPGNQEIILSNGVRLKQGGDPTTTINGWFRNSQFIDWSRATPSSIPVLEPFATHSVNCVIPDESTLTGYNSSGNNTAYTINASAENSYNLSLSNSNWHSTEPLRRNHHVAAKIDVKQVFKGGFSLPTANPSTFVFESFQQVNKLNGKIQNGIVLCDIPQRGKLSIEFTPTETGEIYFWQAPSSTDDWGGKKPTSSLPTSTIMGYDINVVKDRLEKKEINVNKNGGSIWVLYRPLGSTNEGELKNFNITLISEQ